MLEEYKPRNEKLYLAGEGAVSGYLIKYIDEDAIRTNPFAELVIAFILIFAYRTVRGVVLPNLMVLASVVKPNLQYVNIPYSDLEKALLGMGASQSLADNMLTFFKCVNDGKIVTPKRDAENTQPTSIEEFAKNTYKYVYNM